MNNSTNASTKKALNEIVYDMKLNNEIDITNVAIKKQIDVIDNRNRNRQKAIDALTFAIITIKIRYNERYKLLIMKSEDRVYVKLHHEYKLSELKNIKLLNQRARPFSVLKQGENLTYELELPKI